MGFGCPSDPLLGVYSPKRLTVLKPCQWFRGHVVSVEPRSDGDIHIRLQADPGYTQFLNPTNVNSGGMVAEIMPGQNLWTPSPGDHLAVFGTWVLDKNNGWDEIHPVWGLKDLSSGRSASSLPPAVPLYTGNSND